LNQNKKIRFLRCRFIIKDGRRRRYIGFKITDIKDKTILKSDLIDEFRKQNKKDLYVVRFNGEAGIVRCSHMQKDNSINFLKNLKKINNQNVKIDTLGTSGTIKSLIKKHMSNLKI